LAAAAFTPDWIAQSTAVDAEQVVAMANTVPHLRSLPVAEAADSAPQTGSSGRTLISRDHLLAAALRLIGPHRSVSSLSLREVTREAGIAPNSFYRHFRDTDELAVALIDLAGQSLRRIIGEARHRIADHRGVIRSSVEAFIEQVRADDRLMHVLLREGTVGSDAFKRAVDRELSFFEDELRTDLVRLAEQHGARIAHPDLAARAITRLAFAMGAAAVDLPADRDPELIAQLSQMVRMIVVGAQKLGS
jgi:AcrR family transcriptional regulator